MTTAAQRLVALSGLGSATAAQHFLAAQGGSGKTIYCSQGTVVAERWEISVSRPVKKAQPVDEPAIVQQPAPRKGKKSLEVFVMRSPALNVVTILSGDPIYALLNAGQSVTTINHGAERFVVTRRPGA